jgi:hypothetical protein
LHDRRVAEAELTDRKFFPYRSPLFSLPVSHHGRPRYGDSCHGRA